MKVNLTPIIDIVFLLIIFLIIVYQRIDAYNYPVELPQSCDRAADDSGPNQPVSVNVFIDPADLRLVYAVGSESLPSAGSDTAVIERLTEAINSAISSKTDKTIRLRIDKTIEYKDAKLVLAAAAGSGAEGLEIAAVKDKAAP